MIDYGPAISSWKADCGAFIGHIAGLVLTLLITCWSLYWAWRACRRAVYLIRNGELADDL